MGRSWNPLSWKAAMAIVHLWHGILSWWKITFFDNFLWHVFLISPLICLTCTVFSFNGTTRPKVIHQQDPFWVPNQWCHHFAGWFHDQCLPWSGGGHVAPLHRLLFGLKFIVVGSNIHLESQIVQWNCWDLPSKSSNCGLLLSPSKDADPESKVSVPT